jgi:dCTP deaminase
MKEKPWKRWIPGVLSKNQIKILCEQNYIINCSIQKDSYDHSAFDLHLSSEAYEMIEGSIKPSGEKYQEYLKDPKFAIKITPNENIFTLKTATTYVFKLKEELNHLAELKVAKIHGQATAKSTVGRVDVLARLIVDGMDEYESFNFAALDEKKNNGKMYLEITPMTFKIKVRENDSLSQLRLFYGKPEESQINSELLFNSVLFNTNGENRGTLSVDLDSLKISNQEIVAYCAKKDDQEALKMWITKKIDPQNYWELKDLSFTSPDKRLKIEKGRFYILRSKERISLPPSIAVYCRAMDETLGEMRIHYAGFVHPNFGYQRNDGEEGTPLIFEVRGHDVNVNLSDGEKLAKLFFYRMSLDADEEDDLNKAYSKQNLELSKIFIPF